MANFYLKQDKMTNKIFKGIAMGLAGLAALVSVDNARLACAEETKKPVISAQQQEENFDKYLRVSEIKKSIIDTAEAFYAGKYGDKSKVNHKLDINEFLQYVKQNYVVSHLSKIDGVSDSDEVIIGMIYRAIVLPESKRTCERTYFGGFCFDNAIEDTVMKGFFEGNFGEDWENKIKKNFGNLDRNHDGYLSLEDMR